jgi:glycine/D-amino acid oxidase-like deaminating enzyme/nitrite reductase/ring-hydroxylating ferredoxin subunit
MSSHPPLPGKADCCWTATAPQTSYPPLARAARTEVAVIGGGIVGLTAALQLLNAGRKVAVLEARKIGQQVTGRSSAKITSQHGLIYGYLCDKCGEEKARLYADANRRGVDQIRRWIAELSLNCEFEPKDAYAYTCHASKLGQLQREAELARAFGFDADVVERAPLPFQTAGALRFRGDAQFNPARYLIGLAGAVSTQGGQIHEHTRVRKVEHNGSWRISAGESTIEADHVVMTTNLPVLGPGKYDIRTRPRCHIAMGLRATPEQCLDGMFISIDEPTHSLRTGRDHQGQLLILLGPAFVTGQDGDVARRFRELESWTRDNVPAGEVVWRWTNEDYDSPDRIPYVGQPDSDTNGFYIATGFNGWGISNGTAAGLLIADQVCGQPNAWATLYDPSRTAPRNFNQGGEGQSFVNDIDDIPPGMGGVLKQGDDAVAIWKDPDGRVVKFSAACTHAGCTVTWNNADGTWDCPCHGSIFSADGNVIHGPALAPLTKQ